MATSNLAVVSMGISQKKLSVPSSLKRAMSCQGDTSAPSSCSTSSHQLYVNCNPCQAPPWAYAT